MTQNRTTAWITTETAETLRILSEATGIDSTAILHEIFGKNVKQILADLYEGKRLLFMVEYDLANKEIKLKFSNSFLGLVNFSELPPTAKRYYSALKKKEDAELRGNKK
ncbi:MAG: hypothetical protein ABSB89_08555 [Candidatus Bathyarchaeia archaeon]|jgi:hypothetical protein